MPVEQASLISILISMIVLFIWDRVRHDFVSVAALLASVPAGLYLPERPLRHSGTRRSSRSRAYSS